MQIKVTGRAVVVRFIIAAMIQLVSKYNPEALLLKNENKEPIFGVEYTKGSGSISTHGVSFNDVAPDGSAQLTFMVPTDVKDIKAWVKDNFTTAFARLEEIVPQIVEAANKAAGMEARIMEAITIE